MNLEQIEVRGIDDYLAEMTKVAFQSGMGRAVIEAKWAGFVEAFDGFDTTKVAALTPADVDRLASDTRIIRNRRKIEATIANANRLLDLESAGGFATWLRSHSDPAAREKAIRHEFKFLGPAGIHQFLWVVGETVEECHS